MVPLQSGFGDHGSGDERADGGTETVEALEEALDFIRADHIACPRTPGGVSEAVAEARENEEDHDHGPGLVQGGSEVSYEMT